MSKITIETSASNRNHIILTWPNGRLDRYAMNVSFDTISERVAATINELWKADHLNLIGYKSEHNKGPAVNIQNLETLAKKYDWKVNFDGGIWTINTDNNYFKGNDIERLVVQVEKSEPAFDMQNIRFHLSDMQEICKKHGLHITCEGDTWVVSRNGKEITRASTYRVALQRLNKKDIS